MSAQAACGEVRIAEICGLTGGSKGFQAHEFREKASDLQVRLFDWGLSVRRLEFFPNLEGIETASFVGGVLGS